MDTPVSSPSQAPLGLDPASGNLCKICSSIPASFWSNESESKRIKLQPLDSVRCEAMRGCQLCAMVLLHCIPDRPPGPGDIEILRLKRNYDPSEVSDSPSVFIFRQVSHLHASSSMDRDEWRYIGYSLVPFPWSKLNRVGMGEHVDNFVLMETWLDNCRDNHVQCSSHLKCYLPTRLLDLKAFSDSDDIRLVETAQGVFGIDGQGPQYVTLSHCWGQPSRHPITTTKATLSEHMTRIPFEKLSRTFQDAVKICLSLRQRYLWIDSLCIVQDDGEDWAREAALMALVYTHCYFTLAARSSHDSTGGCKMVADIQRSTELRFVDIDFFGRREDKLTFPDQRVRIFDGLIYDRDIAGLGHEPLDRRAWTLQERELSRRVISFSSHWLLWHCTELTATSQQPWENVARTPWSNHWGQEDAKRIFRNNGSWNDIVEDYSSRSVSKEGDKLVALSGLARATQEFYPDATYVGGMWSALLPSSLVWKNTPYAPQPERDLSQPVGCEYIAPSWSWASVRSAVTFDDCEPSSADDRLTQPLKVEKMIGIPKHQDPYGALEYGALILSGALLLEVNIGSFMGSVDCLELEVDMTKNGEVVGMINIDEPETYDSHRKFPSLFLPVTTSTCCTHT
ncbi:heterokaryon incompatibility protein-domain-containing protein [Sordaria brevicollis]|uniref:Heterokaryon incompatibility protein-domain-containing protein n=1 Tax=Sordaria brevicollis TaxID=83679 RepID=A0AAE0PJG9_SORBR|nr:heterokaryon incompatibility protein-domain-containing protein [Sordaria brevicollis]